MKKYLFLIGMLVSSYCLISCESENANNEILSALLNEDFILYENQSVLIENEDLVITINQFFNSPCPQGAQCIWSGIGIAFEYTFHGETQTGIDLVQAFGFRVNIINSDYNTFAELNVTKL